MIYEPYNVEHIKQNIDHELHRYGIKIPNVSEYKSLYKKASTQAQPMLPVLSYVYMYVKKSMYMLTFWYGLLVDDNMLSINIMKKILFLAICIDIFSMQK